MKKHWFVISHFTRAVVCIFDDELMAREYVNNMNRIEGLVLDIEERND